MEIENKDNLIVDDDFEGELDASWEKISWMSGISFMIAAASNKAELLQAINDAKATLEDAAGIPREEAVATRKALEEAIAATEAFTTDNDDDYLAEAEKLKKATALLAQWIGVLIDGIGMQGHYNIYGPSM